MSQQLKPSPLHRSPLNGFTLSPELNKLHEEAYKQRKKKAIKVFHAEMRKVQPLYNKRAVKYRTVAKASV